MDGVIDLARWREARSEAASGEPGLEVAVDRLDQVLAEQRWRQPPQWLVTELLAVQGCISIGLTAEATMRIERLTERVERIAQRVRRAR